MQQKHIGQGGTAKVSGVQIKFVNQSQEFKFYTEYNRKPLLNKETIKVDLHFKRSF